MFAFFVSIHILICVALILVVLLQAGRGGGLAGAFGAGAAQTLFGGRGAATFLAKTTSWLAVAFMTMSILLAALSAKGQRGGGGLLNQRARSLASQPQLPPSTTTFNPGGAAPSNAPPLPTSGAPAGTTPAGTPATTPPGGTPAATPPAAGSPGATPAPAPAKPTP